MYSKHLKQIGQDTNIISSIQYDNVSVWIHLIQRFIYVLLTSFFFFFFVPTALFDQINCKQYIRTLFTNPQISLFSNFFIKNKSHNTIHTFKNYFATVFSISVFSFSKNKLNPNGSTPHYTMRRKNDNVVYPEEDSFFFFFFGSSKKYSFCPNLFVLYSIFEYPKILSCF